MASRSNRAGSRNPFAVTGRDDRPPVPGPVHRSRHQAYVNPALPDSTDPDYTLAYSPEIRPAGSSDGTQFPDDIRIGRRRPPGPKTRNRNEPAWQAHETREMLARHAQDKYADSWKVVQGRVPFPRMPIWEQERLPTRPTANESPTGYLAKIPKSIPRNAAEIFGDEAVLHFSLADHRRVYPIMTQKPQGRTGVNTYRSTPKPWDEQLYNPTPAGTQQTGAAPRSRAFRAR